MASALFTQVWEAAASADAGRAGATSAGGARAKVREVPAFTGSPSVGCVVAPASNSPVPVRAPAAQGVGAPSTPLPACGSPFGGGADRRGCGRCPGMREETGLRQGRRADRRGRMRGRRARAAPSAAGKSGLSEEIDDGGDARRRVLDAGPVVEDPARLAREGRRLADQRQVGRELPDRGADGIRRGGRNGVACGEDRTCRESASPTVNVGRRRRGVKHGGRDACGLRREAVGAPVGGMRTPAGKRSAPGASDRDRMGRDPGGGSGRRRRLERGPPSGAAPRYRAPVRGDARNGLMARCRCSRKARADPRWRSRTPRLGCERPLAGAWQVRGGVAGRAPAVPLRFARYEETSMGRDDWEVVQRLATAHERTREAYEDTFKGHDLHPGTEIAGAWPFITAAYSGIEQTFKFLIAAARGQTVEELVTTRRPKGSQGYRHHHLGRLFESLEEPVRAQLAEQYRRLRTLHPYIGPATAAEFLNAVSAEDAPRVRAVALRVDGAGDEAAAEQRGGPAVDLGCRRPAVRAGTRRMGADRRVRAALRGVRVEPSRHHGRTRRGRHRRGPRERRRRARGGGVDRRARGTAERLRGVDPSRASRPAAGGGRRWSVRSVGGVAAGVGAGARGHRETPVGRTRVCRPRHGAPGTGSGRALEPPDQRIRGRSLGPPANHRRGASAGQLPIRA